MDYILAIDIGSFKTTAIIAQVNKEEISISGIGISESRGVKKGNINNIEEVANSIRQAVNDATRIAGIEVKQAIVSVSSAYSASIYNKGVANLPQNEVTIKQINSAIQTAIDSAEKPRDYEVLHAIPYNFRVDDNDEIEDPIGMNGRRLEVDLHIILVKQNGISNLKKAFKSAGIEIIGFVNSAYSSSIAVLNDDEKELGVVVVDIGATTSDLAIFFKNSMRYVDFVGVGSHHITQDLSMALHTPISIAEKIKVRFEDLVKSGSSVVRIKSLGDNEEEEVELALITDIISARIEETFMLLNKEIENSNLYSSIGGGVVLTGGFTNFFRLKDIASAYFDMPVRIGRPKTLNGLFEDIQTPEFSTVVGLLMHYAGYGNKYEKNYHKQFQDVKVFETPVKVEEDIVEEKKEEMIQIEKQESGILDYIKTLFKKYF